MRDLKGPCLLNHGVSCVWIIVFFSRQYVKHTAGLPSVQSSQSDPVQVHQYRPSGSDGSTHRLYVYECVNHRTTQNQVSAVSLVSVLGCSFTLVLLLSPLHCLNHRHLLGLLLLVPGLILQPGNTRDGMMRTCGS